MNPQPIPPVAAVHYSPSTNPEIAAFPWLIAITGEPITRVAQPDHAAMALQMFPQIYTEGWDARPAMHDAVSDAAPEGDADAISTTPDTRQVSEEPGTGHAMIYAPTDAETPGQFPWLILDPQGHPTLRAADGEHALNALQALPELLDQDDPVRAALDATRAWIWDTYAPTDTERAEQ